MSDQIPSPDSEDLDSLASLPDSAPSDSIESEEERMEDAEREWKESLQQLELLLTMVVVPYVGKYFGRKCAYWGMYTSAFPSGLRLFLESLRCPFTCYVLRLLSGLTLTASIAWAKFVQWKYPVEVVVTSPATFKGVGAIEAAIAPASPPL